METYDVRRALSEGLERRRGLLERLHAESTDCYRLLHGAVEGCPGVTVDRYGPVLLVQTWRDPLRPGDLEALATVVAGPIDPLRPVWNHRGGSGRPEYAHRDAARDPEPIPGREGGLLYDVRPRHGGVDPLLFLDLRAGRRRVRRRASGRDVLNLFSYTCGVGVAAAVGGAREVWNVDFGGRALEVGRHNASANGVDLDRFLTLREDVIPVVRQLAGLPVKGRGARRRYRRLAPRSFDLTVLDPPRWSTGPFGAIDLVRDYPGIFKPALLATRPGGALLVTNNVAGVEIGDWLDTLRRAARKAGRPIERVEVIEPDEDFPSPDGRHPLKMAWLETSS